MRIAHKQASLAPLSFVKDHPQLLHPQCECVSTLLQQAAPVFPRGKPDVEAGDEERDHGPHFHLG